MLLTAAVHSGFGQEKPVSLSGVVSSGLYTTGSRDIRDSRVSFVPLSLNLDLAGYIADPGLIAYDVRPQLTAGPQATEAGFLGGNGITLETTFLGRRSFPLKLTYANVEREDVFYGSLNQFSGFRSLNHDRSFGVNWQWHARNLPQLEFDFGSTRTGAKPDFTVIPELKARDRRYGLNIKDQRLGWDIVGFLGRDEHVSDFVNLARPDGRTSQLDERSSQARFTASRWLRSRAQLSFDGGGNNNKYLFDGHPFDQDVRFIDGSLRLGPGGRWEGGMRAGYTTNLLGLSVQKVLGSLAGGGGGGVPDPRLLFFAPLRSQLANASFAGDTRYSVHKDWNIYGGLNRDIVGTSGNAPARVDTDYINGTAGLGFQHRFSWLSLNGTLSGNTGRMTYNRLDSRMRGRGFSFSAQRGTMEGLELTASFSDSGQRVDQFLLIRSGGRSAELGLGRRVAGFALRGGGGLQRSYFRDGGVNYHSKGLTLHGALEHRLVHLSYSRGISDGNTLQALLGARPGSPVDNGFLLGIPLRLALTAYRSQTLLVHVNPLRRLEGNLIWTRGLQRFDRQTVNDFAMLEVRAGYRFRLLTFEAGYISYDQTLLATSHYMRSRFFIRVSRPFRVL